MSDVIQASLRTPKGTGAVRSTRREGMVPGVIYGGKQEPVSIAVPEKMLSIELYSSHFFTKVYQIEVEGKKQSALAKAVQFHPVTDRPLHVDFMRVDKDSKLHVFVPIEYTNEDKAPGVKRGGTLNVVLHNIEVICPAHAIPEKFVVDLSGLAIGQSLHLDALSLPKDVKVAHADRDNTLITVVAPSGGATAEAAS